MTMEPCDWASVRRRCIEKRGSLGRFFAHKRSGVIRVRHLLYNYLGIRDFPRSPNHILFVPCIVRNLHLFVKNSLKPDNYVLLFIQLAVRFH
jgi:hypothetical protein